jgi:purine-cytosine permease-like protein
MPELENPKEIVHEVVHEVEELVHEAQVGETERAPFIALTGVMIGIAIVVAIVVTGALLAFYLT